MATENRFVWDYWHIPGQYTYFRTLALNVIPPSLLAQFTEALRAWGHANLGADRATMPWLSFYVEGCRQELHSDVIQGMWSYVYSLTPWEERRFTGGETLLAGERLLDYWKGFDPEHSSESRHLIERIPALFDQLCVFDSRLPHGVAVVEGSREPLQARVALHGWFHDPEPSSDGPLTIEDAAPVIEVIRSRWREEGVRLGPFSGTAVWRLTVDEGGAVSAAELVVDNLVGVNPRARGTVGAPERRRGDAPRRQLPRPQWSIVGAGAPGLTRGHRSQSPGSGDGSGRVEWYRRRATSVQTASTTPNGQAPERKP